MWSHSTGQKRWVCFFRKSQGCSQEKGAGLAICMENCISFIRQYQRGGAGEEGEERDVKMSAEVSVRMEGQHVTQWYPLLLSEGMSCVWKSLVFCISSKVKKRNLSRCNLMLTFKIAACIERFWLKPLTNHMHTHISLLQILLSGLKTILKYRGELAANTPRELGENPIRDKLWKWNAHLYRSMQGSPWWGVYRSFKRPLILFTGIQLQSTPADVGCY